MKAFRALLLALTLSTPALYAEETPPPVKPSETPAPAAGDEGATKSAPAKPITTTDLTPAKDVPVTPPPAPPTVTPDLLPAQEPAPMAPGSETTLTPELPTGSTEKPRGTAIEQPSGEKAKKSKTEIAEDTLALQVRLRSAKTRAVKDPAVQAEWEVAQAARTDWEKREALKRYYKLLYTRMQQIDKSISKEVDARRVVSLRKLEQYRIDPTERPDYLPAPPPERKEPPHKPAKKRG